MDLVKVCITVVLPLVVYSVCEQGLQTCEWEAWGVWSSCTRTCAGLRTRTRKMCCGVHVPDCISKCRRPNTSVETEPCATHCPNGGSYIDGYCHCPPLRYGVCCERDESAASGNCARHCTWVNWLSWGGCSTNCGCGTRTRTRQLCSIEELSWSESIEDCNLRETNTEERACTEQCSGNDQSRSCQLCSWNAWQPWSSCSQTCGGGLRSKSRSPCCCEGQTIKDCLSDCRLSENSSVQSEKCREVCSNNKSFSSSICNCGEDYSGSCCTDDSSKHHFMYTIIASAASIVLTSLVWTAAYYIRNRKRTGPPDQQMDCDVSCLTEMDNYTSLHFDRRDETCEPVYEDQQDLSM